ncbi:tyrosine-type recombinase/integrase [Erythrobacter arachoides]|uniref:Tyrosine-type recombinase/integrase n=1 Tax=Aurantiacibacter arachoides TaxID=1850444 RepID=A0A844ZZD9_9SPHN|nr:site-specific integrase [Aurantiacibacter arachoides]MXO93265.1 tyrosine-type recombinase/integrase [Aurantiacibacter arachoides]
MPTARITKQVVDRIEPGAKETFTWDDVLRGFGVRTTTSGAKSYVLQYRMGGREASSRRYTIGKHGSPWTPLTARKEAERLWLMIKQGVDPVQAEHERRRQAIDLGFESYVELFVDLYLKKRWKQWPLGAGILKREAVPVLKRKPLPAIQRSDLSLIWDRTHDRPAIARLTHATLRKLFRWAVSRGDLDRSPLEGVEAPPPVAARDRVLSHEELVHLWRGCEELSYPFGSLFRFLLLTGQRREEVAALDWRELDRAAALWTLPAARSKNGKPNLVPLSALAIGELDELGAGDSWPKSGFVFSTTGATPVSGFSKAKRRIDEVMAYDAGGQAEPWRIHDLRRTVATGLQRLGVRFEVTEAVLNHVGGSRSGVAGVYQRHDWLVEKADALNAWGEVIKNLEVS